MLSATPLTTYKPLILGLGIVFCLLVISGGVSAENGKIEVTVFEPEGMTIMLLLSALTICLGMCGALVYELFIADIIRLREFVEDYLE